MTKSQSLQRVFTNSSIDQYPTIKKFLLPNQQQVFPQMAQVTDKDLDLFDQLVTQNLAKYTSPSPIIPSSGNARTKELINEGDKNKTEVVAAQNSELGEQPMETQIQLEAGVESNPEIVELSKELKEVSKETHEQREQSDIKQKISDLAASATTPVAVSDKPVVVLPITEKSKEEAKFKSTKYSIKWLLEWCKKIAKMFSGAVIYKEEVDNE